MRLSPCEGCRRYLKVDAALCPFCGQAQTPLPAGKADGAPPALSRAALLALAMAGCTNPAAMTLYGAPPEKPHPGDVPDGSSATLRATPAYGAPRPEPQWGTDPVPMQSTNISDASAGATADAGAPRDASVAPKTDPRRNAPAYGGPPAPRQTK